MPPAPPANVAATMVVTIAPSEMTTAPAATVAPAYTRPPLCHLSVCNGLRRDICCSRNNRISSTARAFAKTLPSFLFTASSLASKLSSAVEAGTQELVDRRLKIVRAREDADCFTNGVRLFVHGQFFR